MKELKQRQTNRTSRATQEGTHMTHRHTLTPYVQNLWTADAYTTTETAEIETARYPGVQKMQHVLPTAKRVAGREDNLLHSDLGDRHEHPLK
jgi:hypothetical protein